MRKSAGIVITGIHKTVQVPHKVHAPEIDLHYKVFSGTNYYYSKLCVQTYFVMYHPVDLMIL